MDALYDEILDAGDRLVSALADGDLDAAAQALGERSWLLDRIAAAAPARPHAEAVARFREQDRALCEALRDQLLALAEVAGTTGRVAAATRGYAARPLRPVLLDTVPR